MNQTTVPHYHFSVVQTYEAGRPVLTTVPSLWVSGKYLHWPPKNADELRKNVGSQPSISWNKMLCKVKRHFIPTFSEAEQELIELSGVNTDSDIGEPPVQKIRKKAPKIESLTGMDFNMHFAKEAVPGGCNQMRSPIVPEVILVEGQLTSSSGVMQPPTSAPAITIPWPGHDLGTANNIDNVSNVVTSVINLDETTLNTVAMKEEIIYSIESAKTEIITSVKEHVEKLMAKTMAAMKSDFEAKLELIRESTVTEEGSKHDIKFMFHPVSTIEELQTLDLNLKNAEYAKKLMRHMKQLIGSTGDQYNGQNICYELVDRFFDRKFMTKCSWTGLSRTDVPKIAIQNFKNTLDVFFSIVKSVNEHFSQKAMNEFFKSITRNSKKRSEAKLMRQSAIKRRCRKNVIHSNPDSNDALYHSTSIDASSALPIHAGQTNREPIENGAKKTDVLPIFERNETAVISNDFDEFNLRMMHKVKLTTDGNVSGSASEADESSDSD
ncbi:uncharacterized protein LOC134212069 [Armigeres subalbatus]|uniref:uncharacterized protein LOC134212069 n=1 Tax=Armigeres subalbatus TaxID=124917 RepID=UPI002ED17380